jgi:hypothetical protein
MDELNANAKSFKPRNFNNKFRNGIKCNVKKDMDESMHKSEIYAENKSKNGILFNVKNMDKFMHISVICAENILRNE